MNRSVFLQVCAYWAIGLIGTNAISSEPNMLVVEGAILKTIDATSVSAQVAGVIDKLVVKEGLFVQEGKELGRIRDSAVRIQAEKAKTALDIAKKKQTNDIDVRLAAKNKAVADNEYQRAIAANQLVRDTYPINELDRLKLISDRSGLELERASYLQGMAALESSLSELDYKQSLELMQRHRIIAPSHGVVVAVEKRKGEWVEPGTVLFKTVQIDVLRIEGFLNAADATPDLIGCKAQMSLSEGTSESTMSAVLVFLSPEVNPLNSQVRVYFEVDNKDGRLRPGLRPKIVITKPQ